jgi:hypothetical protein
LISHDYNYWIRHIEKFKEQYGERLEISNCSLEISNSYFKNSPEIRGNLGAAGKRSRC